MKKQITKITLLAMVLFMAFGCEKKELQVEAVQDAKEARVAFVTEIRDVKGNAEKAIVVGTKAELEAAYMKGGAVMLKRASEKNAILVPVGTVNPSDPKPWDPFQECWDEIMAIHDAHIEEWTAQANANCHPVWICLGCSLNLMAMDFEIHPTARKCFPFHQAAFEEAFSLIDFNFGDDQFDTEAVAEFIRNAK